MSAGTVLIINSGLLRVHTYHRVALAVDLDE